MLVLGFAGVGAVVDGLHVLHSQDTLGQSGGPARASVDQPPGSVDVNWPLVLCEFIIVGVSKRSNVYGCLSSSFHIFTSLFMICQVGHEK